MKKNYAIGMAVILSLIMIHGVIATLIPAEPKVNVVKKYPNNWSVVQGGAHGELIFSIYNFPASSKKTVSRIRANAWRLESRANYTLIYYGYNITNDVWPYATCITSSKAGSNGFVRMQSGNFDFTSFLNDGKNQKFWIVKSEDVNCTSHMMTAWNPTEYLFEEQTI